MSNWAEDRIALMDVMLRYAAGVDERDMVMYRSCFHDDVEVHGFGADGVVYRGGDVWTDYVVNALKRFGPTQHMLGPQLATIDGDTAHCRTDVQALHYVLDQPGTTLTLWATYRSDMVRTPQGWKIKRHELVSRGTRIQPPTG
ncbi:MAG: nuclear transport factor 2 family protein [Pseudomonadales bacterium]|nr:nuclear transport factor 2 family protein [Pseudomonadales bacterium]MCP5182750.1 nuclear transport factor 2 family protein [Pseudomonadales bacterium]